MFPNERKFSQTLPRVFHMYRHEHRDQLSDVTPFIGLGAMRVGGYAAIC
jgi:hypothetical protein